MRTVHQPEKVTAAVPPGCCVHDGLGNDCPILCEVKACPSGTLGVSLGTAEEVSDLLRLGRERRNLPLRPDFVADDVDRRRGQK